MARLLHLSHAPRLPDGSPWPGIRPISGNLLPKEINIQLSDQNPSRSVRNAGSLQRKRNGGFFGTAAIPHEGAHLSSGHETCLLRRVCKNLGVADVEVVFVICAEDWCDEGTLSRMTTNLICFGHQPMCRDGQTDRAGEGTDKDGSVSIWVAKVHRWKLGKCSKPNS